MNDVLDDPQRYLDEARECWEQASTAMATGQFEVSAQKYGRAIALLETVGAKAEGGLLDWIQGNLANAHADRGVCLLNVCGPKINHASRALLRAVACGNREEAVMKNILYCIHAANAFSSEAAQKTPVGASVEFGRLHNEGNALLRRPWPPGTPGRNWEGAARMFRRAIEIRPFSASSFYGLGLAYGGLDEGVAAINAWLSALQHDPAYDFEMRIIYDDRLFGR